MVKTIANGACVRLPDGRTGRVRGKRNGSYRVRVRRRSGTSHQFIVLPPAELEPVSCPPGWMSVSGYNRYLRTTLAKMAKRRARAK